MATPRQNSRPFGFRAGTLSIAVVVSIILHVASVVALLLTAKREPTSHEEPVATDELIDLVTFEVAPVAELRPAPVPDNFPTQDDDNQGVPVDEPSNPIAATPLAKPRVEQRVNDGAANQPRPKAAAASPSAPELVEAPVPQTSTTPLLSLAQGRRHSDIAAATPPSDSPADVETLRPSAAPLGPQRLGPAPVPAALADDPGFAQGGETMQVLRRALLDYNMTDLSNGEIEVRPTNGEFVATIRKDGSVKMEHAGVSSVKVCLLASVCLAVGDVRDPGQSKRKAFNRVRFKRGMGAIKHLAKTVREHNEASSEALVTGDVRDVKALPMLVLLQPFSGGFGYRGTRAISSAELRFLDQTEAIRLRMMEKEAQRSFVRARTRLTRELRTVWSDRSLSPHERVATIWTWYLEIDTDPLELDNPQLKQTMKALIEVRQQEAIAAKRVIANFVVEHPQGAEPGFGTDEVNLARAFLGELSVRHGQEKEE